ncbi:hypothetical protein B0F88_11076 [Methylobacter tundripaludum]|uniref:DUF6602 domain-containing protein n=1 Tax=Methylobacter tundripaludum TaxID=173365 RepID=A0A2S6GVT2_9GAMM|nr:DUF6602 domain-containing protein [Methylobacter tundripaludum]PPK69290.1 hypothetical protein B0F88_11076 [Methylobacter tundripaludum]
MDRLTSIQKVNDAEIRLIQQQSALLLQKPANGFNGELKSSGTIVENYIKGLLSKHLPESYRICSGYIATADSMRSDTNLIQHDIIIVDGRMPPIHSFGISDIEVVCAESVCGIIEVKRTLTKDSLKSAIGHLHATKTVLDTYKGGIKSKNSPHKIVAPTLSIGTYAPFYAVIALDCDKNEMNREYFASEIVASIHEFIDFIWVPSTCLLVAFAGLTDEGKFFYPSTVSRDLGKSKSHCCYNSPEADEQARIYGIAIALYRTWINNTSGAYLGLEENAAYFGFD